MVPFSPLIERRIAFTANFSAVRFSDICSWQSLYPDQLRPAEAGHGGQRSSYRRTL